MNRNNLSVSSYLLILCCFPAIALAQTPVVAPGGIVNAADYTDKMAPGAIVSIYGTNLAPQTDVAASVPLPTELAGVRVEVSDGSNSEFAPLFFV